MREPTDIHGSIVATYAVPDAEAVHCTVTEEDGERYAITGVVVTAWFDGEVEVTFKGRPLTKGGTVHKGRAERTLYGEDDAAMLRTCTVLDIDTTARIAVRAVTSDYRRV